MIVPKYSLELKTNDGNVNIILRVKNYPGTIYILGYKPFLENGNEDKFISAIQNRHATNDKALIYHLGDKIGEARLILPADQAVIKDTLGATGYYGYFWPETWDSLDTAMDTFLHSGQHLDMIFIQDRVDREPLGWDDTQKQKLAKKIENWKELGSDIKITIVGTGHQAFLVLPLSPPEIKTFPVFLEGINKVFNETGIEVTLKYNTDNFDPRERITREKNPIWEFTIPKNGITNLSPNKNVIPEDKLVLFTIKGINQDKITINGLTIKVLDNA